MHTARALFCFIMVRKRPTIPIFGWCPNWRHWGNLTINGIWLINQVLEMSAHIPWHVVYRKRLAIVQYVTNFSLQRCNEYMIDILFYHRLRSWLFTSNSGLIWSTWFANFALSPPKVVCRKYINSKIVYSITQSCRPTLMTDKSNKIELHYSTFGWILSGSGRFSVAKLFESHFQLW